jgi:hypothetical protein
MSVKFNHKTKDYFKISSKEELKYRRGPCDYDPYFNEYLNLEIQIANSKDLSHIHKDLTRKKLCDELTDLNEYFERALGIYSEVKLPTFLPPPLGKTCRQIKDKLIPIKEGLHPTTTPTPSGPHPNSWRATHSVYAAEDTPAEDTPPEPSYDGAKVTYSIVVPPNKDGTCDSYSSECSSPIKDEKSKNDFIKDFIKDFKTFMKFKLKIYKKFEDFEEQQKNIIKHTFNFAEGDAKLDSTYCQDIYNNKSEIDVENFRKDLGVSTFHALFNILSENLNVGQKYEHTYGPNRFSRALSAARSLVRKTKLRRSGTAVANPAPAPAPATESVLAISNKAAVRLRLSARTRTASRRAQSQSIKRGEIPRNREGSSQPSTNPRTSSKLRHEYTVAQGIMSTWLKGRKRTKNKKRKGKKANNLGGKASNKGHKKKKKKNASVKRKPFKK